MSTVVLPDPFSSTPPVLPAIKEFGQWPASYVHCGEWAARVALRHWLYDSEMVYVRMLGVGVARPSPDVHTPPDCSFEVSVVGWHQVNGRDRFGLVGRAVGVCLVDEVARHYVVSSSCPLPLSKVYCCADSQTAFLRAGLPAAWLALRPYFVEPSFARR